MILSLQNKESNKLKVHKFVICSQNSGKPKYEDHKQMQKSARVAPLIGNPFPAVYSYTNVRGRLVCQDRNIYVLANQPIYLPGLAKQL